MKDLNALLREGDPVVAEPTLSPVEVAAMRRFVLTAVRPEPVFMAAWQRPLTVATVVVLTLAAGVMAGRQMAAPEDTAALPAAAASEETERRQLQFATPGGTRIIWVFDSAFDLKETTP